VSARQKLQPEAEGQAKPRVVPGGIKSDIARAKELIQKYGLQRLLVPKK
jgi:hypothetical protein